MTNRFLHALELNPNDELVWFKKTPSWYLRCVWRRGRDTITFMAQQVHDGVDKRGRGYRKLGKVEVVYTRPIVGVRCHR